MDKKSFVLLVVGAALAAAAVYTDAWGLTHV